ncbi:uncharacterized protein LOC117119349 isoform X2 [Anneissia japonica]|uniref:uncharacterized protein LOC117119349 isoform X1 n=1 Tax=Anneissia japonica TaxID=1529436 RepID=UPI0014259B67|nr:uncharacterized protein LOC117119349 isoform X1 [Anneissia japonica]XP_033120032.1 uncharacterized protein LOC117119349 isoform X2 [Anneissia japonica]
MDPRLKPIVILVLFLVIAFCQYDRCSAESSIRVGPVSTSAFETSFVRLNCLAYIDIGFEGKIFWLKDSATIADGNEIVDGTGLENIEINSTFEGQDLWSELLITDVTRKHDGRYLCQVRVYMASNPELILSSPSYECTLRVFYLPTPVCPDQAPSFLLNEKVSILCHSDPGEKTATLEWLLNGQVTAYKIFSELETIHTLNYTFVTSAAHNHKIFECRTASESFVMPNTCEFGPIYLSLNISLNPISTAGDSILVECATNGNGDIEYTFYRDDVLATSGVTGNRFQVIVNEYDTVITCQAVDSDLISGSINITLPGRRITVSSDMTSEPSIKFAPTVMTTSVTLLMPALVTPSITTASLIPPPMEAVKGNNVGVAIGSSCAAIVFVVSIVTIGCLFVRKKLKHTPTSANDDLFLEEAFGRKKSLNVSFRKIQKRQSKQNNNEVTNNEDVNDGYAVQFLSEREIKSSSGTGVMPDVITSANQNNLAYSSSEENPVSALDHDAVGEKGCSENGESNKEYLCLESHSDLQTKNINNSKTEGKEHKVHPEMPLNASTVSSMLDSLIKDTDSVQESDKHQKLSTKSPSRNHPQNDSKSVVPKEQNVGVEESVMMQVNNDKRTHSLNKNSSNQKINTKKHSRHADTDRGTLTHSSEPNDDTFDGSNFDDPPKEILPFIGKNAQLYSASMEAYKRQLNSKKRVDSVPTAGHTSKPIDTNPHVRSASVNTTAGKMTGKGVVNPSHKRTSQTHERRSHRGEQNVVWNTSAKSKAGDRPQNQLTVTRNKHASGRSHWDEPQSTRPSNRMQPTVKQFLRSDNHHDAMLHPIPPVGSTSHVVRNPGAKKSR